MIILNTTTDSLEVVLGGAVTTNECRCMASWRDITVTAFTPGRTVTLTTGATAVTAVAAPAASTQRVIDLLNVYNADTVAQTATVQFNANGTKYVLCSISLAVNETLQYVDGVGWVHLSASGTATGVASITGTAGEITASQPTGGVTLSLPVALVYTGKTVTNGTFNTPTLLSPNLGTPSYGTLNYCSIPGANLTGPNLSPNVTNSNLTSLGASPNIGTPSYGVLNYCQIPGANLTGASLSSNITSSNLTSFGANPNIGTPSYGILTNCQIPAQNLTGAALSSNVTNSSLVSFGNSPNLVTPNIGAASASSVNGLVIAPTSGGATANIAAGKTLKVSNTVTVQGNDSATLNYVAGGALDAGAYQYPSLNIVASDIDWSAAMSFKKTIIANTTFTFSNTVDGETRVVAVTGNAANYTVTWPAWPNLAWPGNIAPVQTNGAKVDVYSFTKSNATIYGVAIQNYPTS